MQDAIEEALHLSLNVVGLAELQQFGEGALHERALRGSELEFALVGAAEHVENLVGGRQRDPRLEERDESAEPRRNPLDRLALPLEASNGGINPKCWVVGTAAGGLVRAGPASAASSRVVLQPAAALPIEGDAQSRHHIAPWRECSICTGVETIAHVLRLRVAEQR
ncbi:MAG: hypothetical protein QOD92_3937 [Acidimicrobiaceae bacterium]